ncbi:MAG: TetR/AcrR family transcriptional regulator [Tannerella sp.]|jgi:AcrR family transcriptional regulator|nr:TetR/AcrR family transcriptional regulator [Tannerella sp.]
MPRTKEQYEKIRQERRELIRETALKLFATKGYAATSINEIAQSAGISKGLMYNYFASKEDVMQTIWDDLSEMFYAAIDSNHDGEVSDEEMEVFIDKLFDLLVNCREEMKLYYQCSFQPEVLDFLQHKLNTTKLMQRQQEIVKSLSERLPIADADNAYFSVLVFLKGLSMVVTYTESVYDNGFLMKYKEFLKECFSHN